MIQICRGGKLFFARRKNGAPPQAGRAMPEKSRQHSGRKRGSAGLPPV